MELTFISWLVFLFTPSHALAHASDRGYVLLLPTGYYLFGGAVAVAASFLALFFVPQNASERLAAWRLPLFSVPEALRFWTSLASFLLLGALVAAGIFGSRDPLSNPLPLTVWTLLWIGLTIVQGLLGNLWRWLDPWYAPVELARAIMPNYRRRALPQWFGYWPAVLLFAAFAWFELIDAAPDDPYRLAFAVGGYWLLTFAVMLTVGHEQWAARGEFLSVFFRMISRFGVLDAASDDDRWRISLCLPGAKLWREQPLPLSGTLFLLLALASVSFDGFSKTFMWLGANGINPLEFPGRSAMQGINATGLALMFLALAAVFLICVFIGERLAGEGSARRAAGLLVWSIVPIALAYHFSHYLTAFLVNAQYAAVSLSDPFGLGWNLFGTAYMPVSAGIVMGSEQAFLIWNAQAFAIIGGHVLAVLVAHGLAGRLHAGSSRASLSQLPLTLLMIGYTVFGLWLLSTPTAG
ncbi:hypothetical protein RB623_17465 [Mesorhizobium sp. LHD-90]|uniref:hypothetical protein n=1 Tax=Mesorhizobium sp. LHD-90 TaxID=3071414 RepID=UPI0027DFAC9A|nr:hypothetical protein [Mesorhizobium sp. LHD-90]MDQ6435848.1 hypothetical protein [Mesorhizobium sp. LHD-90]